MKSIIFISSFLLLNIQMAGALAAGLCPTTGQVTTLSVPDLSTILTGNTICVGPPVFPNVNWESQEYHQSGGSLIDWKQGASSVADPTAVIGTWSIAGSGAATQVTYNYTDGGSSTFSYTVFDNGSNSYSFCQGTNLVVTGMKKTGQGACP